MMAPPPLINSSEAMDKPFGIKAIGLDEGLRDHVHARLHAKLAKFGSQARGVEVRMGKPRRDGAVPQCSCAMTIFLARLDPVVVERVAWDSVEAFDHALGVAERTVRRTLQRRRHTK